MDLVKLAELLGPSRMHLPSGTYITEGENGPSWLAFAFYSGTMTVVFLERRDGCVLNPWKANREWTLDRIRAIHEGRLRLVTGATLSNADLERLYETWMAR